MNTYLVTYEVRSLGSIGAFWHKSALVTAANVDEARETFRADLAAEYEFRSPVSVTGPYNARGELEGA